MRMGDWSSHVCSSDLPSFTTTDSSSPVDDVSAFPAIPVDLLSVISSFPLLCSPTILQRVVFAKSTLCCVSVNLLCRVSSSFSFAARSLSVSGGADAQESRSSDRLLRTESAFPPSLRPHLSVRPEQNAVQRHAVPSRVAAPLEGRRLLERVDEDPRAQQLLDKIGRASCRERV